MSPLTFSILKPAPKYMVDNERNTFKAAPDKGILNGPVTGPIQMSSLKTAHATRMLHKRDGGDFWIDEIQHGKVSGIWHAIIALVRSKIITSYRYHTPLAITVFIAMSRTTGPSGTVLRMIRQPLTELRQMVLAVVSCVDLLLLQERWFTSQ